MSIYRNTYPIVYTFNTNTSRNKNYITPTSVDNTIILIYSLSSCSFLDTRGNLPPSIPRR